MASLDHYYGQVVEAVTEDEVNWKIELTGGTFIRCLDEDAVKPEGLKGLSFMASEEQGSDTILKFGIPAETDDILESVQVGIPTDSYTISYEGQTEEKTVTLEEALPEDPTPERVVDAPLEAAVSPQEATEAPTPKQTRAKSTKRSQGK